MFIKKLNHNTYDVWIDKGWDFWGRFKIKYGKEHNQVFQVGGTNFPKEAIKHFEDKVNHVK